MRTTTHFCVSVRGALRNRNFAGMQHNDGRPMTKDEAFDALCDELAQGHEVVPMGECDNFDFKKGCQGHKLPDEVPA